LCPYCWSKIFVFYPPGEPERISLYCSSGECRGLSVNGIANGYDIMLKDITSPLVLGQKKKEHSIDVNGNCNMGCC
jgi:hypothetical protein